MIVVINSLEESEYEKTKTSNTKEKGSLDNVKRDALCVLKFFIK